MAIPIFGILHRCLVLRLLLRVRRRKRKRVYIEGKAFDIIPRKEIVIVANSYERVIGPEATLPRQSL